METVIEMVQQIILDGQRPWALEDRSILVTLLPSNRVQKIQLDQEKDQIVLRSVVLKRARVVENSRRWRELARGAWMRNATHDLVTFAFDRSDRLIGLIRHPSATLDRSELELYVDTLARECDRFEYVLTGGDAA